MLTLYPRRAVYFSMGSNIGDRRENLTAALRSLAARGVDVARVSPVYETAPMYVTEQPAFLNMAAVGFVAASPEETLRLAQEVEKALGRNRDRENRNGPRKIDIDIVSMEGVRLDDADLTLPHPRMAERAFVLKPLADIAGALTPPGWACDIDAALSRLPPDAGIRREGPPPSPAPADRRDNAYNILLREFSGVTKDGFAVIINLKLKTIHPGRNFTDDISAVMSYEDVVLGLRRLCAVNIDASAAALAAAVGDLCLSFPRILEAQAQVSLSGNIFEGNFLRTVG